MTFKFKIHKDLVFSAISMNNQFLKEGFFGKIFMAFFQLSDNAGIAKQQVSVCKRKQSSL